MCRKRSLYCLSSSSIREPIIFSYLLKARNKHEWTSESILFQPWKDVNTHTFSSLSPPKLIYSPVWFVCWARWRIRRYDWSDRLSIMLFSNCQLMDRSGVDYLWIIVMFYQLFGLSFWRHPFTAEDPLVSKWFNATFLLICSHEETNSSTSRMVRRWIHFQQISILGWTIPLIWTNMFKFFQAAIHIYFIALNTYYMSTTILFVPVFISPKEF